MGNRAGLTRDKLSVRPAAKREFISVPLLALAISHVILALWLACTDWVALMTAAVVAPGVAFTCEAQ